MAAVKGEEYRKANFRTFDTICSATQDRQDAVNAMLASPPDVMLVVGGYNSSNTLSLAALCAEKVRTYHVEDALSIDPSRGAIHARDPISGEQVEALGWLGSGPVTVGLTAGASTPNNKIGDAIARVFATRGIDPADLR
jgi:4-hydroxy-3-methylbut-2-enyl diphosphate reductase